MQLDKNMILDLLRQRGDHQSADQADQELPDQVDTDAVPVHRRLRPARHLNHPPW